MRNVQHYRNKKITIIGFARSGLACANLLGGLGAKVSVSDNKDSAAARENILKLESKDIKVELGAHSEEFIKGRDLIVISPGVPKDSQAVILAKQSKIPVIGEIELAWDLCPATICAVTGSSGKTTVTTLIARMLEAANKNVFLCGNIGNPFSGEVKKIGENDFVSLEISSFQLEWVKGFKPKISLMLNFARNHLDRHMDMQEYLEAKSRIFLNQDSSDYLVLNRQDPVLRGLAKKTKARVVFFSESKGVNPNQAAASAVGSILGISEGAIQKAFAEFKGIEHRLEYVSQVNDIKFFNDSKATTAESTLWALRSISGRVVLIAGGKDKGVDYGVIRQAAREKVREIILIGEAKEKIESALKGSSLIDKAKDLEEAVHKAFLKARAGDSVLLSPMCSSFDMFSGYEERGNCFKKAVLQLAKPKS